MMIDTERAVRFQRCAAQAHLDGLWSIGNHLGFPVSYQVMQAHWHRRMRETLDRPEVRDQ